MNRHSPPPSECAQCGASIPPRALACPACGADERTCWRDTSVYDGMELPESAWSDETTDDSVKTRNSDRHVNGIPWYWWCVGVALLLFLGLGALALL